MAIDGFKIALTTAEMRDCLTKAIDYHTAKVASYQEIERLTASAAMASSAFAASNLRGTGVDVSYSVQEHRRQVLRLTFLRDHLIPDETYILDDHDANQFMVQSEDDDF